MANALILETAMGLHYTEGRFYFFCGALDSALARSAGFTWQKDSRNWSTPFCGIAKRVAKSQADRTLVEKYFPLERQRYLESAAISTSYIPPSPEGKVFMPFQRAGVERLIEPERVNALLGDEPGLGKTIQCIGAMNVLKPRRALIICPASLKINWLNEWKKWSTLNRSIDIAYGGKFPSSDIVIINYDILARNHARVHGEVWPMVVMDEAHMIANPEAARTKEICGGKAWVAQERPLQAVRKIAVTGTPFLNRPIELHTILKYLAPADWPIKLEYAKQYCNASLTGFGWDMKGYSRLDELQYKLRCSIMIRRMKADVLKDLPPKVRQVIEIEPTGVKGKALVKREKQFMDKALAKLGLTGKTELTELEFRDVIKLMQSGVVVPFEEMSLERHALAVEKIPFVITHLENAIEEDSKVVCFCHHTDVVRALKERFGGSAVSLVGGDSALAKEESVRRFQTDPSVKLFIGNIKAAGVGITLTAAKRAVFAELDWVPGIVEQAEDRLHRIGAKAESIFIQYLIFGGSMESAMAKAIVRKADSIDKALDMSTDLEVAKLLT